MSLDLEPIEAYPAPWTAPLSYPGRRPESSFLMLGTSLTRMEFASTRTSALDTISRAMVRIRPSMPKLPLSAALEELRVAPLSKRVAVIGYGSNPVPGQLASKFGTDAVLPVVKASLANTEVVYNLISNRGYAFAELMMGESLGDCAVFVTFLDRDQLQKMIATEQNYQLARIPTSVTLESGQLIGLDAPAQIFMFAGFRRLWVPSDAIFPIAVAELRTFGSYLPAMTQTAYLALTIKEFGLQRYGITTPMELAQYVQRQAQMADGPGKLKYELQSCIHADPRSRPSLAESIPLVVDVAAIPNFVH